MKVSALTLANLVVGAVLLLTPFFVGLTSSAPYDSWYDLDENGKINIFDVVRLAGTYGTAGDPGKNVTLVGRANNLAYTNVTSVAAGASFVSPWISVDGYSKVTVSLYTNANNNNYRLQTRHSGGPTFHVDTQTGFGTDLVKTYDVPNEEIRIVFINGEASARSLFLDVYVTP